MTSATRRKPSWRRPSIGRRSRGSTPSRTASPRRSSSMRPTSGVDSAHARLAEFPPDTTASSTPQATSTSSARPESSSIFCWSGTTPLWQARLVPMPVSTRPGRCRIERAISTTSTMATPSRRSPSSTISTTPWVVAWRVAAAARARRTVSSVLRLTSALRTTASTWLGIGERTSVRGASNPRWRSAARFSTRESPRPTTPASTSARATLARASTALVMPDDPDAPRRRGRPTRWRALCPTASRSTSRRGALTVWLMRRGWRSRGRR